MRITPKRIAVPNPDAPRPIIEKNSSQNQTPEQPPLPAGIMPTPTPTRAQASRAAQAKATAGIERTEMVPQPTPGGTMMTMRPATRKKAAATADERAERLRIAREKQEQQRLSARKTAREAALEASRKEARAQVLAKKAAAREEARKARRAAERAAAEQPASAPRPKRSDPPQLRVVEGSAGRRQGGA